MSHSLTLSLFTNVNNSLVATDEWIPQPIYDGGCLLHYLRDTIVKCYCHNVSALVQLNVACRYQSNITTEWIQLEGGDDALPPLECHFARIAASVSVR